MSNPTPHPPLLRTQCKCSARDHISPTAARCRCLGSSVTHRTPHHRPPTLHVPHGAPDNAQSGHRLTQLDNARDVDGGKGLPAEIYRVISVNLRGGSKRIISVDVNDKATIYDSSNGAVIIEITIPRDEDEEYSGGGDGGAPSSRASRRRQFSSPQNEGAVEAVAWHSDKQHVAFGCIDGAAYVFDAINGQLVSSHKHHTSPITAVGFSPSGSQVVTGSKDAVAAIFCCATSDAQLLPHDTHTGGIHAARFSQDGRRVITASYDLTAVITDVATKAMLWRFHIPDTVGGMPFPPTDSGVRDHGHAVASGTGITDAQGATEFFWKATLACLSTKSSNARAAQDLQDLNMAEYFKKFDLDGDGFIDEDEMRQAGMEFAKFAGFEITERELLMLHDSNDSDEDGRLSLDEFTRWINRSRASRAMANGADPGHTHTADGKGRTVLHHLAMVGDTGGNDRHDMSIDAIYAALLCVRAPMARLLSRGLPGTHAEDEGAVGCSSLDVRLYRRHVWSDQRLESLNLVKDMGKSMGKEFPPMVNVKDVDGRTALAFAVDCSCEQPELVDFLLDKKADPILVDNNRRTPLHFACFHNHVHAAKSLLEHFANVNAEDRDDRTPLLISVIQGSVPLVFLLLQRGARVDKADIHGWLPLSYALMPRRHTHAAVELFVQAENCRQCLKDLYTTPALNEFGTFDVAEESQRYNTIATSLVLNVDADHRREGLEQAIGKQTSLFQDAIIRQMVHERAEMVTAICDPTVDHTADAFCDPLIQKGIDLEWHNEARPTAFANFFIWSAFLGIAMLCAVMDAGEFSAQRYFLRKKMEATFIHASADDGGLQFPDVNSAEDLWSWIDNVFVAGVYPDPQVWRARNGTFEGASTAFDEFVGRPRMRTLEGPSEDCSSDGGRRLSGFTATCFSPDTTQPPPGVAVASDEADSDATTKASGRSSTTTSRGSEGHNDAYRWYPPAPSEYVGMTRGALGDYPDGGLVVTMPRDKVRGQALVAKLKASDWINLNTRAFIVEFVAYNPNGGIFITASFIVEISRAGLYFSSFHLMEFPLLAYSAPMDFLRLAIEVLFLLCFIVYVVDEYRSTQETWEENVNKGSDMWKLPSRLGVHSRYWGDKLEAARKSLALQLTTPDVVIDHVSKLAVTRVRAPLPRKGTNTRRSSILRLNNQLSTDKKPRLLNLLGIPAPEIPHPMKPGYKSRKWAARLYVRFNVVVRPYFFDPLNWSDVITCLSFMTAIIFHVLQLIREISCIPDGDGGDAFSGGPFEIARLHQTRMYLLGVSVFLCWIKLFEYLRLNEKFATMFFIIIGMMSKITSFVTILLVVLLAFTSLDFIAFGGARARSDTFLASLGANFEATLGDVDFTSAEKLDVPFGSLGVLILIVFILVCVLVLLNLLIAHMTDAYTEVNESANARWAFIQFAQMLEVEKEKAEKDRREEEIANDENENGEGQGRTRRCMLWIRACFTHGADGESGEGPTYRPVEGKGARARGGGGAGETKDLTAFEMVGGMPN